MKLSAVRAEILRLRTQGLVWTYAALLIVAASWGARWSPKLVDLVASSRPQLSVSIAGAVEVASAQIATGPGVILAALFVAAGPGRDFVDGSAEVRRTTGGALGRFLTRVLAVALLIIVCGAVMACVCVAVVVVLGARHDFALDLRPGDWNFPRVLAGAFLAAAHATWVLGLAQRLRTQASQLALPIALVIAMLLVSRLSVYPLTPDSWLGPILGLRAERAMLDFWWSVGGDVLAPWGNAALIIGVVGMVAALGVRSDLPVSADRLDTVGASGLHRVEAD